MNALGQAGFRVTGNLNEGVGDAQPGTPTAGQSGLPTVEGAYGQLGVNVFMDTADLLNYTNASKTNAVLYGGWFKYCLFKATWSATLAIGQPLYYASITDMLANTVTPDATATAIFAGIALNATTTKGNYWWMQTSGIVYGLGAASVADTTAGNLAVLTGLTTATIDGIADATDYYTNAGKGKSVIGKWIDAPANATIKRLLLTPVPSFQ